MPDRTFEYTRSTGKRRTYTIKVTPGRYVIYLDGTVLKEAFRPLMADGDVMWEDAAADALAINDIEDLNGMPEE